MIARINTTPPTLFINASPNLSATKPVIILPIVIPQKKREEKDAALDSNSPPDTMYVAFHTIIVFSKAQ